MYEEDNQGFVDTTPQSSNGDQYVDPTHIPNKNEYKDEINGGVLDRKSKRLAKWIREKQWGVDVREALALFVEWLSVKWQESRKVIEENEQRQSDVETRQTKVEGEFERVIANATRDSEVILARDSVKYGIFPVLDQRLEHIEYLLSNYVPDGFGIYIKHNQGRNPRVTVKYYENALGTEIDGFNTESYFGEVKKETVNNRVEYPDSNSLVINLPIKWYINGKPNFKYGDWYIIEKNSVLKISFDMKVNEDSAISGNESNYSFTENNGSQLNEKPTVPYLIKVSPLDKSSNLIEWSNQ